MSREGCPSRYWPGGVPASIKFHDDELSNEELLEESKGWLLFIEETWVSREQAGSSEEEYELHQRRSLMQQWAEAEQSFRDSFQNRATPRMPPNDYPPESLAHLADTQQEYDSFMCIANINTPAKRARFIKLLILTYRLDGDEMDHPMGDGNEIPNMATPNPATFPNADDFAISDFPSWAFLEVADFKVLTMTSTGTVLLNYFYPVFYFIDNNSLETGQVQMVEFGQSGAIKEQTMRRAYNLIHIKLWVDVKGYRPAELDESPHGGCRFDNKPMNMDLPVVEILETAQETARFRDSVPGDGDLWEQDIEIYAPGYQKLEAEGRGHEYDIGLFRDVETAAEIRELCPRDESPEGDEERWAMQARAVELLDL